MKVLSLLFVSFLFLHLKPFAQEGWVEQTSGTGFGLASVYFTDIEKGWTVGSAGTVWDQMLNTTNGGTNWNRQVAPGTGGVGSRLHSVYFIDNNTGWAVGMGALPDFDNLNYKTADGGEDWRLKPNDTEQWLSSVYFADYNTGWAVGDSGTILYTTDGGANWNSQASGTDNWLESVFFIDQNKGWTVGRGGIILHTTNGGVSFIVEDEIDEIPKVYRLTNNYPNPFNPTTKIKYSVPQSSQVRITIFDILGNEIETLVNEEKPAGSYEVEFDASLLTSSVSAKGGYASGVYFYRLQAGEFIETKKMVLLR